MCRRSRECQLRSKDLLILKYLGGVGRGGEDVLIEAKLVKSGLLICFEEDVTMRITRSIARDRIVSRAEAMDGPVLCWLTCMRVTHGTSVSESPMVLRYHLRLPLG
jgi:hypothetical protein